MRVCFVSNFKVLAVLNEQRSCEYVNCLLVCKQNASVYMRYISTLEYCLFSCFAFSYVQDSKGTFRGGTVLDVHYSVAGCI